MGSSLFRAGDLSFRAAWFIASERSAFFAGVESLRPIEKHGLAQSSFCFLGKGDTLPINMGLPAMGGHVPFKRTPERQIPREKGGRINGALRQGRGALLGESPTCLSFFPRAPPG